MAGALSSAEEEIEEEGLSSAEKAKDIILKRLYSVNHDHAGKISIQSRKEAFSKLKSTLEHTVQDGYSSSLIIRGPHGAGKSWLVSEVLRSLNSDPKCRGNYVLVQLSGLVHLDDHQALLDVATQLGLHQEQGKMVKMSFVQALKHLMESLKRGDRGKKSIIFIIESFEAFIHHRNQALLYNLLDVAQTDRTPIAVVGVTTCVNAPDLLEKRVRSRLSFQEVILDLDFSFEDYVAVSETLLSLPSSFEDKKFLRKWRARVEDWMQNLAVLDSLRDMYHISPNFHSLRLSLAVAISQSPTLPEPTTLCDSVQLLRGRYSMSSSLAGLSVLELTLAVAIHHLTSLNPLDPFNFEMVYNEYKKYIQRIQSANIYDKKIAMKAFEHLAQLQLIYPVAGIGHAPSHTSKRTTKEHRLMTSGIHSQELKEAVRKFPNCPTDLSRWALSQTIRY